MRSFLTEQQAENFFAMIKAKDMDIVHMALDMILATPDYLPYRYNDQGSHRLKRALDEATCDAKRPEFVWKGGERSIVEQPYRSREYQRRLNKVRAKHTLPWDWRLIE